MDTTLSEEEVMVRETARKFLEAHCPTKLVREMEKDPKGYPPALWKQAAELGWQGLALPETIRRQRDAADLSGPGVGRGWPRACAVAAAQHGGGGAGGRPGRQRGRCARRCCPAVAAGDAVLTWAFHEQNPLLVPEAVQCQAVADGDDFVINGNKTVRR